MSKQSTNFTRICASLFLGFTQVSFAAPADPALLDIPPPPILRNPMAPGNIQTTPTYNTGNTTPAAVGTSKSGTATAAAPSTEIPKMANPNPGLFAKSNANNGVSATSTQSDNANAVNAEKEAAKKVPVAAARPTGVIWGTEVYPAANTMYSNPLRR